MSNEPQLAATDGGQVAERAARGGEDIEHSAGCSFVRRIW